MLESKDLNTQSADFLQFYLRMGQGLSPLSCNGRPTRLLVLYSTDAGIRWNILMDLNSEEFESSRYVYMMYMIVHKHVHFCTSVILDFEF